MTYKGIGNFLGSTRQKGGSLAFILDNEEWIDGVLRY